MSALVVTLLGGVAAVTTAAVRRPFPQTSGDVEVSGIEGRITVLRDARGVPQVYADTAEDLFRAQGWVHAQDRFFEMDWRRHVTAGRLSELVGADEDALLADKVIRTLGWRQVAQSEVAQADPSTRAWLAAYAEGVNAYLATRSPSQLSLQYSLLGLSVDLPRIEPWTPEDSVAWFKAMAWDLRGNYDDELERARVLSAVKDVARVRQLFPPYPYDRHAPILSAADVRTGTPPAAAPAAPAAHAASGPVVAQALSAPQAVRALDAARRAVRSVPRLLGRSEGTGSNSWVVAGRLTATGKPLLANDPHLAASLPGVWYQAGLHCRQVSTTCPFDVAGYTFAGVPGVVIGHNGTIAWGMTNLGPDVTDFYLERTRGSTVARDGAWVPMTVRTETIAVAGGAPVTLTVRSTSHGPVLSDVLDLPEVTAGATGRAAPDGDGYAVALAWTALTPGHDMDAVFAVDAARDFASFRAGVLRLDVPAQNMVYADDLGDHGHIGYQAPGRIPVRGDVPPPKGTPAAQAVPSDGSWPLPGWDSRYDWRGFVPADDLPWTLDPAAGYLVAANQAVTPPGKVFFTNDFDYGWRSQRIRDLVAARTANGRLMTVTDMAQVQVDTRNPMWEALEPLVLAAPLEPAIDEARDLLRGWDGTQSTDSAAAAYFNAFWVALLDLTFADELPEGDTPNGGQRWMQVVTTLLDRPKDRWWDDRRTPDVVETRDGVVRQALVEARLRLTRTQGKNPATWTWGHAHTLTLQAVPTGQVSATGPLHPLLNAGPVELPGANAAVDALGYDASSGTFAVVSAPSMRMVVDLADPDRSRWVNQTGQSGHPGSPHYTDQLDAWATGKTFPWPFSPVAVREAATDTLTLRPPG